jgi:FtsZ-binding cell division protein ZapB
MDATGHSSETETLTQSLFETALALSKRHGEWANTLAAREAAMHAENEELKRKTMAELASARAAARAELEAVRKQISEEQATWQAERERISHTQKFQARVKVDVGGLKITTSRSTLQAVPGSMLDAYFSGRHTNETDEEGYHFIDRDGTHFRHILNFLRDPSNFTLELPGEQMKELLVEAEYYGLTQHMAGACPALAEMLRKKHLGWLADATVGCYVECKMPQAGVEYLYVDSVEMGSDGRPMQLDVIMCTSGESLRGFDDFLGHEGSVASPALMQFKQTIQHYLRSGNKLAGALQRQSLKKSGQPHAQEYHNLQQYGLVHERVTVAYDGAKPALRGKSKKLQYACSINAG